MIQTLCRGWDSFPRNRLVNITVPATFGFPQGHNLQLSCYFFLHSCYSTTFFSHSQLPTIFPSIHSVHFLCLVCKQAINVLSSTKIIKNTARSFIKRLPLTQVQMWFPVHLDDIVKAHQSKSLQRRKRQCLARQHHLRDSTEILSKWIVCMLLISHPINREHSCSCAFLNITYQQKSVSLKMNCS